MTNNIRERIKQRSEPTSQEGGIKLIETNDAKLTELRQGTSLAWNTIKIFFQQLLDYIHLKLRPFFNTYLNWGDVFEQDSLSGERTQRTKLKEEIFKLEQSIKNEEEKGGRNGQTSQNEKDKKSLKQKRIELANIKDIQYISIWAYFVAFFKSFTEKTEDDMTPQEKIMKKRGNKYGTMPRPSFGIVKTLVKPVIVVGLLVVSILSNFMVQKKYISQLIDQKTDICNAIFQSKVYPKGEQTWNPPYNYFNNIYNTQNKGDTKRNNQYLLMRDYYTQCSYKTYLGCGYETTPTLDNIKPIILAGARVLHFDVFEDVISTTGVTKNASNELISDANEISDLNKHLSSEEEIDEEAYSWTKTTATYVPMVRCATNDVSIGISFDDVVSAIKDATPFDDGMNTPFIIYLDMWHQDASIVSTSKVYEGFRSSTTYDMIYDVIEHYFGKNNGDRLTFANISGYGFGGLATKKASLCNIPMNLAKGKILLISNISPQKDLTGSLSPYLYATVSYPTIAGNKINGIEIVNRSSTVMNGSAKDPGMEGFIYDEHLYNMSGLAGKIGAGLPDLKNYVQSSIMIAIPGMSKPDGKLIWKNSLQNPNFLDCFQYGIQFVFMNYQECLKETNNYIQFFVDHEQHYIVKRHELRYITYATPLVKTQVKALSYEARIGATIGDGPNPFFRSIY